MQRLQYFYDFMINFMASTDFSITSLHGYCNHNLGLSLLSPRSPYSSLKKEKTIDEPVQTFQCLAVPYILYSTKLLVTTSHSSTKIRDKEPPLCRFGPPEAKAS